MRAFKLALLPLLLAGCATQQTMPMASTPAATAARAEPAPLSQLVSAVDIPYESFTLANGLTTLVHTDRKSPVVGVTVYYRVGSKSEPEGRTGFAHLFEHLMFGGSENVPNFDIPLEGAGSTSTNGSTWYDRTNYVETVPTGALDLALFMESDRMGHLLGAVTQDKLDKQRGVVQNEKRQGDNQPYGLADYAISEELLPVGHPYRHATIGSMADLDAASLADVRQWFTDNYGPNNVVLVLAGDIDAATARPKVERWFGAIPRGPEVARPAAAPVSLPVAVSREMADQIPVTRIFRSWTGPGLNDADAIPLQIGMHVLGGLASSRLDTVLVRDEQLAVSVSASAQQHEKLSFLQAQMDVKPGVDRAQAEARLDQLIADYVAEGPTADELQRASTQFVSAYIGGLEQVGGFSGKGATLAEGLLYSDDPAHYKAELAKIAALTPDGVKSALQRWLGRPVSKLAIVPGTRTEDGATMGGWGDEASRPLPRADPKRAVAAIKEGPKREFPAVAPVADLTFPKVEHAALSNGIAVTLARRTAVPKVLVSLDFDAGNAADGAANAGTQSLMMSLLDEGTTSRSALEIAEEQERLGASIGSGTSLDASSVTLNALSANLAPSLALMADIVRNPAFADVDVGRVKDQYLAGIAQELASPYALANRTFTPLVFGTDHPYSGVSGLGTVAVISAITPAALRDQHTRWLRPDLARITVVGDATMADLLPRLEAAFGNWQPPATPAPTKNLTAAIPSATPKIVVVDRPNSPQSVILAGRVLPLTGTTQNMESLDLANEVLGDGFLSRLNMDLREDKGWSYGVRSGISGAVGPRSLTVAAPVQADKTGDSVRLLLADMADFPGKTKVTDEEVNRVTDGNIRGLPNRFQTNGQVLGALIQNQRLGRPDDYYSTLATRYRAIDAAQIDAAAREYLQPAGLVVVVVGDRKVIDGQLSGLGLPIEYAAVDTDVSSAE